MKCELQVQNVINVIFLNPQIKKPSHSCCQLRRGGGPRTATAESVEVVVMGGGVRLCVGGWGGGGSRFARLVLGACLSSPSVALF